MHEFEGYLAEPMFRYGTWRPTSWALYSRKWTSLECPLGLQVSYRSLEIRMVNPIWLDVLANVRYLAVITPWTAILHVVIIQTQSWVEWILWIQTSWVDSSNLYEYKSHCCLPKLPTRPIERWSEVNYEWYLFFDRLFEEVTRTLLKGQHESTLH